MKKTENKYVKIKKAMKEIVDKYNNKTAFVLRL